MSLPTLGASTAVLDGQFLSLGLAPVSASEFQIDAADIWNINQLSVSARGAGAGAGTIRYTLRVDGVDTVLVVDIPAASADRVVVDTGGDSDIFVRPGSLLSVRVDFIGVVSAGHTLVTAQAS